MNGAGVLHRTASRDEASRDDWKTPPQILDLVRVVAFYGEIALDPATTPDNPTGAVYTMTPDDDAFDRPWRTGLGGMIFLNPEYSRTVPWISRAVDQFQRLAFIDPRTEMITLTASRTDTVAFHDHIAANATGLCFWRGRIKFVGAKHGAPFPSLFAYYGERYDAFRRVFDSYGLVTRP